MERLILARHGHALSNVRDVVSSVPPGEGLSERGLEDADGLRRAVAGDQVELAVVSQLVRTRETLERALDGRDVRVLMLASWNEIGFGAFEGGPLHAYRDWAWTHEADEICPGGGETRGAVALRVAATLETLIARPEATVLAVGHALPVRYVLDAAEGLTPRARITPVSHAVPHRLTSAQATEAAVVLRRWGGAPSFAPAPQA